MDANQKKALKALVKETLANLEGNGFEAAYVDSKEDLLTLIKTMVPEGASTATGGSATLRETGVLDYLKEKTAFIEDRKEALGASIYLASANALTVHGELYEVDGRGNRVAAMIYGPDKVIVVAGINKLCLDLREAVERVKTEAAPPNSIRLDKDTPCAKIGRCVSPYYDDRHICALGCNSDQRICSYSVIFSKQMVKNRIAVIIVGEDLGY